MEMLSKLFLKATLLAPMALLTAATITMAPLPSNLSSSLSSPPNGEQSSLLSIVKLAAEILGVLVLIITLILAFRKLTTSNAGNANQNLPEGNHDNIQLAVNFNAV